jgi:hypothetical protein
VLQVSPLGASLTGRLWPNHDRAPLVAAVLSLTCA